MLIQGSQELNEVLEKGNEAEKKINEVNKEYTLGVQMGEHKENKHKAQLSNKKADPIEVSSNTKGDNHSTDRRGTRKERKKKELDLGRKYGRDVNK